MPRNKKTESTIAEALDTPVERTLEEAADYLGVAPIRLQELFCDRLQSAEPMVWLTIPTEHEQRLEIFKREIDAENSVRRFDTPTEPAAELPPVEEELPIIQDEAPKPKRGKGGKLTEKKTETITKETTAAEKLNTGIQKAEQMLTARKGAKTGAKLATIELLAQETAYNTVKSEGLKRKVAQLVGEIAEDENFDPADLLAEMGLDSNSEILETLTESMTEALGKYDAATQEVIDTSWANSWSLDTEMAKLTDLLN
jgi:hypothetical protein